MLAFTSTCIYILYVIGPEKMCQVVGLLIVHCGAVCSMWGNLKDISLCYLLGKVEIINITSKAAVCLTILHIVQEYGILTSA